MPLDGWRICATCLWTSGRGFAIVQRTSPRSGGLVLFCPRRERVAMAENVSLITWMANLQIRFLTWRRGELVGADRFGNRYFRERKARNGKRERRWVLYAGESDASRVPPEWRGWLHHTFDQPLPEGESPDRPPWRREYEPNASGTLRAYRPPGHAAAGGHRMRATGDYEAWTPP